MIKTMIPARTGLIALLLASTALCPAALAQGKTKAKPLTLTASVDLFPTFRQHDKRGPLPIMPIYDLTRMPGDWPYKRDEWDRTAVAPPLGALDTVVNTTRPVVAGFGFTDNGGARQGFVDVKQRVGAFFLRGVGTYKWAESYEDGDGDTVRFGYNRDTEQLVLGYRPDSDTSLKAIVIRDEIRDNEMPETTSVSPKGDYVPGADSVRTTRYVGRLVFDKGFEGTLEDLHAETKVVWVNRRNNNFEFQDGRQPGQRQEATPERRMVDGLVHGDFRFGDTPVRIGLRGLYDSHDAERATGADLETLSSINYPDITRLQTRVFAETALAVAPKARLDLGLRWDFANTSLGRADDVASWLNAPGTKVVKTTTPRTLYRDYYGETDLDRSIHAVSLVGELSRSWLNDALDTTLGFGRIARLPDNQELYFSRYHGGDPLKRAIGNPGLDPEVHYRAEAGASYQSAGWLGFGRKAPFGDEPSFRIAGSASFDHVEDFISRDRARGQSGGTVADEAIIWRNVDARFASLSLSAEWNVTRTLTTGLYGRATWAENLSEDRGLYGIAPAELVFLADYHDRLSTHGTWNVGLKVRAVADPTDPDDDLAGGTALDPEDISGFATLDLYGGVQLHDRVGIRLGISNVLDTEYAELDPHYVTDTPDPGPVNAPGRTFFLWTVVNF